MPATFSPVAAGSTLVSIVQPAGFQDVANPSSTVRTSFTVKVLSGIPVVTISATDNTATEAGATTGTFTITRAGGNLAGALNVNFTRTGTTTAISDFVNFSSSVSIPANQTSATVTITPINDAVAEGDETVILALAAGAYDIGAPNTATVTIVDDDD